MFKIPFYSNTADNSHCFQACLKMVLKYFFPKENYSFTYLDKVTMHKPNQWTWVSAPLLFLSKKGIEIINIEDFDYKAFSKKGESLLKSLWTKEMFFEQERHSNFKQEQILAKKMLKDKKIKLIRRPANLSDMRKLYNLGYILMPTINPLVLDGEDGYLSHIVVITKLSKNSIEFHDPGLPAIRNRKVPLKKFMRAMRYPNRASASLIAIRKNPIN